MQKITRIAALLLVVLAVVLAIVAFNLGRNALKPAAPAPLVEQSTSSASTPTPAGMTAVVVTTRALPAGQPIPAAALRMVDQAQPVTGSYRAIEAVAGDVPLLDLPAETTVTAGVLAHGVALALKPGERALAVPVDELAGAGNRILPGDYVDVFLSLKATQPSGLTTKQAPAQARLLLWRLRVLAYGSENLPALPPSANQQAATNDAEKSASKTAGNTSPPPAPRTAVLAVPVNAASRLLLGAQSGTLSLALRHPTDDGRPDDTLFLQARPVLAPLASLTFEQQQQLDSAENKAYAGIDGDGLAGQRNATPTTRTFRRASPTSGVEIIRGTQRSDLRAPRSPSP